MAYKPVIILIDDNSTWLEYLSGIINTYFIADLQSFISFEEAKMRLLQVPSTIDLLITDIYPDDKSREKVGFKFADFVHYNNKTPVIVITGDSTLVKNALNDYNYITVFDKGDFDLMNFITVIRKILDTAPPKGSVIESMPVTPPKPPAQNF
ncbi:MAG: hypothetical protein HYZ42_11440 [Bacteroidetes bacterium]|nr:hypothetical protein [Bacteroidota bacterium]